MQAFSSVSMPPTSLLKQQAAVGLIATLRGAGAAVLSTPILQSFVNVALCELRPPPELVRRRIGLCRRFEMVVATADLIGGAHDLHVLRGLSFYGALIVQAAVVSGCE